MKNVHRTGPSQTTRRSFVKLAASSVMLSGSGPPRKARAKSSPAELTSMEGNVPVWWPMSGLDLIPDAETALKVGRVILERYYGDSFVCRYEPYRAIPAIPHGEEWWVLGSREDKSTGRFGGGFPELSIAKKDG